MLQLIQCTTASPLSVQKFRLRRSFGHVVGEGSVRKAGSNNILRFLLVLYKYAASLTVHRKQSRERNADNSLHITSRFNIALNTTVSKLQPAGLYEITFTFALDNTDYASSAEKHKHDIIHNKRFTNV